MKTNNSAIPSTVVIYFSALLIFFSPAVQGATVSLSFTNLPSAQGWVYEDANNSISEQEAFSIITNDASQPSGILHLDTTGRNPEFSGSDANRYIFTSTNLQEGPFQVSVRVRVTANFTGDGYNPYGFAIGIVGPEGRASVAITTNSVAIQQITDDQQPAIDGYIFTNTGDNTAFHTYTMTGFLGTNGSFSVYRDGIFLFVSPNRLDDESLNPDLHLTLGTQSGGAVAIADVVSFSALTGGPYLAISKAVKLRFCNLITGQSYQLQSSPDSLNWNDSGSPFTANFTTEVQYVDVGDTSLIWRLKALF